MCWRIASYIQLSFTLKGEPWYGVASHLCCRPSYVTSIDRSQQAEPFKTKPKVAFLDRGLHIFIYLLIYLSVE